MSRNVGIRLELPELQGPWSHTDFGRSSYHTEFNGSGFAKAAFIVRDGYLPDSQSTNDVRLSLEISGGKIAKRICIKVYSTGFNVKKSHKTQLEFYQGIPGQLTDFSFRQEGSPSSAFPEPRFRVQWITTGGLGAGFDVESSTSETAGVLNVMRSLLVQSSKDRRPVSLIVETKSPRFKDDLATVGNQRLMNPWHPYLNKKGLVPAILKSRSNVQQASGGGLIRFPERNYFSTPEEAHVAMAYGTAMEYLCGPNGGTGLRGAWPRSSPELYLNIQLEALAKLFARRNDLKYRQWKAAVLNHDPTALEKTTPISMDLANVRLQQLLETSTWDIEQEAALRGSMTMTGNVALIHGPPGSGKTRTLAGLAALYANSAMSVMLCAPSASAAEALATALSECLRHFKNTLQERSKIQSLAIFSGTRNYRAIGTPQLRHRMSRAHIIITTPNFVCSPVIRDHFGEFSKGIMVFHDDSHMSLESEILATVFSLKHGDKVKGLVLATECLEWPMDVVTQIEPGHLDDDDENRKRRRKENESRRCRREALEGKPFNGLNEFADQIGLHLAARLIRQGFPVVRLKQQHRMAAEMISFPKARVYKQYLNNALAVSTIPINEVFARIVRNWLTKRAETVDWHAPRFIQNTNFALSFVNVVDGWVEKAENPRYSKWNAQNVDVVADLLIANHKDKAVQAKDIVVVTYYRAQVLLYGQVLRRRAQEAGINMQDLPSIVTLDSFRGKEAPIVILDIVVHDKRGSHGLGMVGDEYRAIVATTRAKEALMIVGNMKILERSYITYWVKAMTLLMTDPKTKKSSFVFQREKVPYFIDYAEHLRGRRLVFDIKSGCRDDIQYQEPEGKEEAEIHEGSEESDNDDDDFQDPWRRGRNQRVHDHSADEETQQSQRENGIGGAVSEKEPWDLSSDSDDDDDISHRYWSVEQGAVDQNPVEEPGRLDNSSATAHDMWDSPAEVTEDKW